MMHNSGERTTIIHKYSAITKEINSRVARNAIEHIGKVRKNILGKFMLILTTSIANGDIEVFVLMLIIGHLLFNYIFRIQMKTSRRGVHPIVIELYTAFYSSLLTALNNGDNIDKYPENIKSITRVIDKSTNSLFVALTNFIY
jgi:hypothetical protein